MRLLERANWRPKRSWVWSGVYAGLVLVVVGLLVWFGDQLKTRHLPSGSVQLTVPYSRYLLGEAVTFTITNNYNAGIAVPNNCPAEPLAVYRAIDGKWVRVHDTTGAANCAGQTRQVQVPAHGSLTTSFAPWQNLFATPGKYRIVASVDYYHEYPYQDIEIVQRPVAATTSAGATGTNGASGTSTTPVTATKPSGGANGATGTTRTPTPLTPAPTPLPRQTISVTGGSVTVTYSAVANMIYVQSITPAAGYTYEGGRSGSTVQITFKKGASEVQLTLYLRNGQLRQTVEGG